MTIGDATVSIAIVGNQCDSREISLSGFVCLSHCSDLLIIILFLHIEKTSHVILCYVMLCYFMLRYVTLCYVILFYVTLCYVMLFYVMLCYGYILREPLSTREIGNYYFLLYVWGPEVGNTADTPNPPWVLPL